MTSSSGANISISATGEGPIHRAVWDREFPVDFFDFSEPSTPASVQQVMDRSVSVVERHRAENTLWDDQGRASLNVLQELGEVGFWGLRTERECGGVGGSFYAFAQFITRMTCVEPAFAGLALTHNCIGAVNALQTFGTEEQKRRLLAPLASGARLAIFALTEPGVGSDLTALRTTAAREGDDFLVTGEKLFITNAAPGRTVALVCLVDQQPAMLICELPDRENESFQLTHYGLYPLRHTANHGIRLNNFRVPANNLIRPLQGDGLQVAYHGLNRGRVALCATAAGNLRRMLASLVPWTKFRTTYRKPIAERELVCRRVGQLAGWIVGCDALVRWCASLLDRGLRGELECIAAKNFAAESQKSAAIEVLMKTHGGRSFLHGHLFGDSIQEFLAPCIYEGEGEILGLAFFRSLVKQHQAAYFAPLRSKMQTAAIDSFDLANPTHWLKLGGSALPYAQWLLRERLLPLTTPSATDMPAGLQSHVDFAKNYLRRSAVEISRLLGHYGNNLSDRQCIISDISIRIQKLSVILAAGFYASRQKNELVIQAVDVLCRSLTQELTGKRPSDVDYEATVKLGKAILDGGYRTWVNFEPNAILLPYLS